MSQAKYSIITVCLIVVLLTGLTPAVARADNGNRADDQPVRLSVSALAGPIGMVKSLDAVTINGRRASGDCAIWGGELIQASANNGAQIVLESVGQVSLRQGTVVRLATTPMTFDDNRQGLSLVAALTLGNMAIHLQDNAAAYIEAGGAVYHAARGAAFRVAWREDQPELEVMSGSVQAGTQTSQARFIRPVGRGLDISLHARGSRQLQVRVTDANDKPLPDVPVVFALTGGGVGTLAGAGQVAATTVTVSTAANGVATVTFAASATPAAGTITAAVPGTAATASGSVSVSAAAAGLSTGVIAGIAAAAAGGTVAGVVAAKKGGGDSIKDQGTTTITPNSVGRRQ